jgi:hypothetical protein
MIDREDIESGNVWPDPVCDFCDEEGHYSEDCPELDSLEDAGYSEATGDYGQYD